MNTQTVPTALVIPPDGGTVLHAFGNRIQMQLTSEQTNGTLAAGVIMTPPGGGPPPHVHANEDEMFFILDGQFRFLVNEEWTQPHGAGTVVYLPRGSRHTFQNVGDTDGHFWAVVTPGGFEQFFARCADVFAQPGPPDMSQIIGISTEHGIEYVPNLTGDLPVSA